MRYVPNAHLFGCTLSLCTGCVEDTRPAQRPASTSDARKRRTETTDPKEEA